MITEEKKAALAKQYIYWMETQNDWTLEKNKRLFQIQTNLEIVKLNFCFICSEEVLIKKHIEFRITYQTTKNYYFQQNI